MALGKPPGTGAVEASLAVGVWIPGTNADVVLILMSLKNLRLCWHLETKISMDFSFLL